MSSEPHRWRNG